MLIILALIACKHDKDELSPGPSKDALWPFPSAELVVDGHLSIPAEAVPMVEGGTALDVDRFSARTGFSPVQTAVVDLGLTLDKSLLPTIDDPFGSDAVQVWDLTDGVRLSAFAELDAYPELDGETPVLLVRPLIPYTPGHQIAVALTDALRDDAGAAVQPVGWFQAVLDGNPGPGLEDWEDHYVGLASQLSSLGVGDLVLAFDFPIGEPDALLQSMLDDEETPTSWTFEDRWDADEGAAVAEGTWFQLEGSFQTRSWLGDGDSFTISDGLPVLAGTEDATLFIHVPDSVRDAAPGTVPVWIFGHGIFGTPRTYLNDNTDGSAVVQLADRAGAILVATTWRGLSFDDLATVLGVSRDFGRLPRITDRLAQGVANTSALTSLILDGGLLDDPALLGLPDKNTLRYFGISLGSIEGAVLLAHEPRLEHAVLHVGGGDWSLMLERSNAWLSLEPAVVDTIPSARERQLLYALSQLYWDPADPAGVAHRLADRSVLWQESMGDELVSNLSTGIIARAVGLTQLEPDVVGISTLSGAEGPLFGPALAQYDPELGTPADENRPPESSGAHQTPRHWDGCQAQIIRFLDPTDPGVAKHYCGSSACTAENTGTLSE